MINAQIISDRSGGHYRFDHLRARTLPALCRALIRSGQDPAYPLKAWRGETLCLTVRSIGKAAVLAIPRNGIGFQTFRPPSNTVRERAEAAAKLRRARMHPR